MVEPAEIVNATLEVRRGDLADARVREEEVGEPEPGRALLRIERFALTANNITYGVIGEMLGYWDFFPAPDRDQGWGRIPAMGWAEVVASAVDGIEPGGRYYGWFPMGRYCSLDATPTDRGLRDDSDYRAQQAPVYRAFVRTDLDPLHVPGSDAEDRHALLRGLFATGYLIDGFFAAADQFGAGSAIVLSASSKTAIAYAHCASERGPGAVVGLTSEGNRQFVEGLGCYDRVLAYGEEGELPRDDAVVIDMAGNGEVLSRVHSELGDRIRHSMIVGMSHHDAPRGAVPAGPEPQMFFAPTEIKTRVEELGRERYERELGIALAGFIEASESWLRLERSSGPEAALDAYRSVLGGATPPSVGRIVSLH